MTFARQSRTKTTATSTLSFCLSDLLNYHTGPSIIIAAGYVPELCENLIAEPEIFHVARELVRAMNEGVKGELTPALPYCCCDLLSGKFVFYQFYPYILDNDRRYSEFMCT